jgi:hypothetical protein
VTTKLKSVFQYIERNIKLNKLKKKEF